MRSQTRHSPVISFQKVTFAYDKFNVIDCASFDIFPGEFIGIIGPNGGGKTTALKLMLGLLKPGSGTVSLSGKVGYVPQINAYDKQFPITVKEVVMTGCLAQMNWLGQFPKHVVSRVDELLLEFDLQGIERRAFGSLSGGQAQKTLIARALASDPQILLLDEPTANIDSVTEKQIFAFLKTLQGQKTLLVITHNFDAIIQNVKRVLCFQKEVSSMDPTEVCEHFAIGMYHPHQGVPK